MKNNIDEEKLYSELDKLRQKIKNRERFETGRAPTVCTDESLSEIARLMPERASDFSKIKGLGTKFIENYAAEFANVVLIHTKKDKLVCNKMTNEMRNTLKKLEKKLVNINKRNKLLYLPKIIKKNAYDLFSSDFNIAELKSFLRGKEIVIASLKTNESSLENQRNYSSLTTLIRQVEKDYREKGHFDLYLGYPFVIGRMFSENFDVRAPLMLFPIEIERTIDSIKIKIDKTKDAIYNNVLVLAKNKFSCINKALPEDEIEDIKDDELISKMIMFYETENIDLKNSNKEEIVKLKEYGSNSFPKYKNGEFEIEYNAVLGKFPMYSNAIQKDFTTLQESSEINEVLGNLLLEHGSDFYSDNYGGINDIKEDEKELILSEKSLHYINEINSSQENVIASIKKEKAIVIQGPPGTGKSQTITSLISDYAINGKTVLMVSEKKAALDVVYSRLGNLKNYVIKIDDVNNKVDFYNQMNNIVLNNIANTNFDEDLLLHSKDVDENIEILNNIADKLFSANEFGIEMYKLYLMNKKLDLKIEDDSEKFRLINSCVESNFKEGKYEHINSAYTKFKDKSLRDKVDLYYTAIKQSYLTKQLKANLTEYEVMELIGKTDTLNENIKKWKKSFFLKKLFTKGKVKKEIRAISDEYLVGNQKKIKKYIMNNLFDIKILYDYENLILSKTVYEKLSEYEINYWKSIHSLKDVLKEELTLINESLFSFLIQKVILKFESDNRTLFSNIENFEKIIDDIDKAITTKKTLCIKQLENVLKENIHKYVLSSKESKELLRKLESKRKWSVIKFIDKFSFELLKGVKIWLVSPEVVSSIFPCENGIFDLIIFDEASQMYVENGLPSIMRGKKIVIAGDSKQLRPSSLGTGRMETVDFDFDSEEEAALEEESLLDLARFRYSNTMLNFHYRSKYEELIAFSNHAFYNGRLYVSPNVEKSKDESPIEVIKIENGLWSNRENFEEAKRIVLLLKEILSTRQNNETIGIITFNSNQRDKIMDLIDAECTKDLQFNAIIRSEKNREENGEDIGLFIKNIENVQGDERDIIIFSIGYAKDNTGKIARRFGWLNQKGGENRLNVAISRAKKKKYVVTSFEPHELYVEDLENEGPKILKKYLEYCFAVSNKDKESAKQILLSLSDTNFEGEITFDSDFENQVYDALIDKGLTVHTQVGIGGYRIDLAILKNDKYILGIECDGKLYHSSKVARERDYHRQKYLESRGWKIHRIWSPNWWKNPELEVKKIVSLVESLV